MTLIEFPISCYRKQLNICNAQINSFSDHVSTPKLPNNRYRKQYCMWTNEARKFSYYDIILPDAVSELRKVTTSDCACPGDNQIYECTVVGGLGGITVWRGTAFNCEVGAEINLLHSQFVLEEGAFGNCNGGAIRGRSLRIENNRYISQLSVMLSSDLSGETIECIYDNGRTITQIGNYSISLTTGIP